MDDKRRWKREAPLVKGEHLLLQGIASCARAYLHTRNVMREHLRREIIQLCFNLLIDELTTITNDGQNGQNEMYNKQRSSI